jgi:hypothetical protein
MAVKQDTRQKLLFAIDDWEPEEQPNICTKRWTQSGEPKGDELGEWSQVIRSAVRHAINGQNQASKSGWERKCLTVVKSLAQRKSEVITQQIQKLSTWRQRCISAKILLRAKLKRPTMNTWKKKCSGCTLNHKRKHKERLKRTAG